MESGSYFNLAGEVNYDMWMAQMSVWLIVVLITKLIQFYIQLLFNDFFYRIGQLMLTVFETTEVGQILFVFFVFPLFVNILFVG